MTKPFDTTTYIIDTSVLLSDANSLFRFPHSDIVIPLVVISELQQKTRDPILGFNARKVLRTLEELRTTQGYSLRQKVKIGDEGGTLRIEINSVDMSGLPDVLKKNSQNDMRILAVAHNLSQQGDSPVLISKDLPLRLLASVIGIPAEDYTPNDVAVNESGVGYSGVCTLPATRKTVDDLYAGKHVANDTKLPVHTGVILEAPDSTGLATVNEDGTLSPIRKGKTAHNCFGVKPRSVEQTIALHHLMNPDVPIVSLGGRAGTGKSVLALAAALELVMERKDYRRIIVFRPVVSVGDQDLGFLPGTEEEKMSPWGAAVFDALRAITTDSVIDELMHEKVLEILPLTHIRGRTLGPDVIVIVDETQNLEKTTILTALTRLGEGSRMFLLHDVSQRDNLRVGRHDGIYSVVETLKDESLFAHITLSKSERSPVAEMASRLLDDSVY